MYNRVGFEKLGVKPNLFSNPNEFRNLKPNPLQTHLIKFQTLTFRVGSGRIAFIKTLRKSIIL